MKIKKSKYNTVSVILLLLCSRLPAIAEQQLALTMKITDSASRRALPNVVLTLKQGNQIIVQAQSDSSGNYRFAGLAPGAYLKINHAKRNVQT